MKIEFSLDEFAELPMPTSFLDSSRIVRYRAVATKKIITGYLWWRSVAEFRAPVFWNALESDVYGQIWWDADMRDAVDGDELRVFRRAFINFTKRQKSVKRERHWQPVRELPQVRLIAAPSAARKDEG